MLAVPILGAIVRAQSSTSLSGALSQLEPGGHRPNVLSVTPRDVLTPASSDRPVSSTSTYELIVDYPQLPYFLPHGSCAPPPSSDQLGALAKDLRIPAPCDQKLTTHGRPPLRTESQRCEVRWSYACVSVLVDCYGEMMSRVARAAPCFRSFILQIGLAIRRFVMQLLVCHQLSHCYGPKLRRCCRSDPESYYTVLGSSLQGPSVSSARVKAQGRSGTSLRGKTRPSPAGPHARPGTYQ